MTKELTAEEMDAVKHYLNTEQKLSVLSYAHVLADCAWATEATVTAIDKDGLNVQAGSETQNEDLRIDFPKSVNDALELRMAIMSLAMKADIPDGVKRVASAEFETPKASRYLKALCSHFSKKAQANFEVNDDNTGRGQVKFEFGDCTMAAEANTLTIRVSAESDLRFNRIKYVVGDHLFRFSHREALQADWVDGD
ncbi:MAG: DUF2218 domain-containing protein [Chloroflexota bacterium]